MFDFDLEAAGIRELDCVFLRHVVSPCYVIKIINFSIPVNPFYGAFPFGVPLKESC